MHTRRVKKVLVNKEKLNNTIIFDRDLTHIKTDKK